ncbi:MAG: hypothetical protein AAFR93_16660, partial [Pseudomonadota bacterium]
MNCQITLARFGQSQPQADPPGPSATTNAAPNTTHVDQITDYLVDGYWNDNGFSGFSLDLGPGRTISVNLTGLDAVGRQTAEAALAAWTAVSGITFQATTAAAQITFDDNNSGAFANTFYSSAQGQ